jgi:hypothetical protein
MTTETICRIPVAGGTAGLCTRKAGHAGECHVRDERYDALIAKKVGEIDTYKVRGKNVTSSDPRKPEIVRALKDASGGSKVTLLREVGPGVFVGHCLVSAAHGGYDSRGYWQITTTTEGR